MSDHNILLTRMQPKRNQAYILAAAYVRLGMFDKAQRVKECGTYLGIADTIGGGAAIMEANFCRERLCPLCSWRRSLRIYANTSRILDYIDDQRKDVKYLFLTLTVRNVRLGDLSKAIDSMADAYKRLTNNKAWKRRVLGAMRTLEVTIDWQHDEAHPHYHLILAVPKSYATANDGTYWSHDDWMRAWRQAARLDYDPSVRIERIKGSREHGIAEVSKYMAKDSQYLIDPTDAHMGTEEAEALTDYLVDTLDKQMRGRRLVSYTGILGQAQRAMRLSDPEAGDLTDANTVRGDIVSAIKHYHWHAGLCQYVIVKP